MLKEEWFPTSIYYDFIDIYDTKEKINNIRGASVMRSNRGGYQSPNILNLDEFKDLISVIEKKATQIFTDMYPDRSGKYKVMNIWINIGGKNSYNISHTHPNSDLSGCLYVKTPKKCGNIVFEDPRHSFRMNELDNYRNKTRLTFDTVEFIPEEGKILFFPNWLQHRVENNESDEERMSVAFNLELEFDD